MSFIFCHYFFLIAGNFFFILLILMVNQQVYRQQQNDLLHRSDLFAVNKEINMPLALWHIYLIINKACQLYFKFYGVFLIFYTYFLKKLYGNGTKNLFGPGKWTLLLQTIKNEGKPVGRSLLSYGYFFPRQRTIFNNAFPCIPSALLM